MAVLDTNCLIALEQRDEAAAAWLEAHRDEEHVVPDVVAVEYLTGHTQPKAALAVLGAAFRIGHTTPEWIETATTLRKRLRRRGGRFRAPDFWIAAWADHLGASVVTRDLQHFKPFGVDVESW